MTSSRQTSTGLKCFPNDGRMKARYMLLLERVEGRVVGELVYADGKRRRTTMREQTFRRDWRITR